ncbi:MAG: GNAT family N-acetyltransferase [Bacteroidales bacterium]
MSHTVRLTTERLLLKPINTGHSKAVYRYRTDSVTNRYQGWIQEHIQDIRSFITNRTSPEINQNGTWFQLVVALRKTGEIIGDIGMHFLGNRNEQFELGCTIARGHQGNGYAKEALIEVIRYLFETLDKHRLIATIDRRTQLQ